MWFDELGKPWDKHACFIPEEFHSTPAMSGIQPIRLVRVRDVLRLRNGNGYAIYYGRDGRASDAIDVFANDEIPGAGRSPKPLSDLLLLTRRWIYIDHARSRVTTLDGSQYNFQDHDYDGGWKRR